jgi:hypothetical protein
VLAESVNGAARRGARILLTAPVDGPVAAAVAGQGLLLPPRVASVPGLGFARAFTAGLVLTQRLGLLGTDIDALADELDREAERNHPMHESFVNPAKALALRMAEHTPLLWGLDPAATAVAAHASLSLACFAGVVADVAQYPQAVIRPALYRSAVRSTSGADLFADPTEDVAAGASTPPRVMLLDIRRGMRAEASRRAASDTLPGADVLAPADEVTGDEALCAAVLGMRFDMAALYLGLASGTLGGPGLSATITA